MGAGESHVLALCMLMPEVSTDKNYIASQLSAIRKKVNEQLEPHEQLAKLVVVKDEWTIANGFITPTLKIRRNSIDAHYGSFYAGWLAPLIPADLGAK